MDTGKSMNWDWDKLQQQQQKRKTSQGGGGKSPGGGDNDGGSGPGGGNGGMPPQMEDFINKFKGGNVSLLPVLQVLLVIFFYMAGSMVFRLEQNEVGVVQRFGKYTRTETPGLHFKMPSGIEKVTKVLVKRISTEEFGFRANQSTDRGSRTSDSRLFDSRNIGESLMLTGDLNVAVVPWIVQYRISKPQDFLFNVREPINLLRDMSEATMRLVVGDRSINEVLSSRAEIADEAQELLQKELDAAQSGIYIAEIELQKTNVPPEVQSSFNKVNQSLQEKERMIQEARKEYNKAVPAAKGEAERVVKAAEGYAIDRVNRAQGDAGKFSRVYDEYRLAKDVTRRRLYLETMEKVLPKLGEKYIVDSEQKNLLPLLNLGGEK